LRGKSKLLLKRNEHQLSSRSFIRHSKAGVDNTSNRETTKRLVFLYRTSKRLSTEFSTLPQQASLRLNFEFMANSLHEARFGPTKKIKKYLWTKCLTVTIPANIKSLTKTYRLLLLFAINRNITK
jgi:hypothetical protein